MVGFLIACVLFTPLAVILTVAFGSKGAMFSLGIVIGLFNKLWLRDYKRKRERVRLEERQRKMEQRPITAPTAPVRITEEAMTREEAVSKVQSMIESMPNGKTVGFKMRPQYETSEPTTPDFIFAASGLNSLKSSKTKPGETRINTTIIAVVCLPGNSANYVVRDGVIYRNGKVFQKVPTMSLALQSVDTELNAYLHERCVFQDDIWGFRYSPENWRKLKDRMHEDAIPMVEVLYVHFGASELEVSDLEEWSHSKFENNPVISKHCGPESVQDHLRSIGDSTGEIRLDPRPIDLASGIKAAYGYEPEERLSF